MPMYDLLILNACLVTDTETQDCDIGIKDEKIVSLEPKGRLADADAGTSIDAQGAYVTVGSSSFTSV